MTFYPVTRTLAPDMQACRNLQKVGPPDIFLLVHYFGQPTAAAATAEFCARAGAWLIEDAAHVLRPIQGIGTSGDFVLYSPHKHLPIPEGAVLVARPEGPTRLGTADMASFGAPSSWAGQLDGLQRALGCSMPQTRVRRAAWLIKRAAQRAGLRYRSRSLAPYSEQAQQMQVNAVPLAAPEHGSLARRLLTVVIRDLAAVARRRERHQLLWDAMLTDDGSGSPPATATERPRRRNWTPYLAAYHADQGNAEATYLRWQGKGMPVTTWPDLPPEVTAHPSQHPNAWSLRHDRIYLPVHQSLGASDMARLFRAPSAASEHMPQLRFLWDHATRSEWGNLLTRAGRSNLLQSWAYGAAKASTSAWRVTRCIVYRAERPIAMVQVLQRRIAGALRVSRINRGPIFLEGVQPCEQSAVWEELGCLGNFRHGRVLTVAPETELSGSALLLFARQGFRQFSPLAWESAWVDLGSELTELRKGLAGKWRNMLSSAEKAGLTLDVSSNRQSFEWMMDRYRENMRDKSFVGPDIELLRSMYRHLETGSSPIVMRAVVVGQPVAGICLIPHGAAATYLLGWSGSEGRDLKANHYLLWQAIEHLKQRGLRWFDLGGIDEDRTPGIAAFKLGINGERYESVGEFWKW